VTVCLAGSPAPGSTLNVAWGSSGDRCACVLDDLYLGWQNTRQASLLMSAFTSAGSHQTPVDIDQGIFIKPTGICMTTQTPALTTKIYLKTRSHRQRD